MIVNMDSNQPPTNTIAKPAPYKTFTFSLMVLILCLVPPAFSLAFATAMGTPNAFDRLRTDGAWLAATIGLAIWVRRKWSEIIEIEADDCFRQKHRSFTLRAGVVICSVLVVAALVGSYFGVRAKHLAILGLLSKRFSDFGVNGVQAKQRFIQAARRETPTMAEYIQRSQELEAALNEYEPQLQEGSRLLGQTQEELQYLRADDGYAKLIPSVTVLKSVFDKDMELAKAYRKEVKYAKQLADLPPSEDAPLFYRANIQPARDEEDKIAKAEIEILKDARARGVQLPESMYHEAGIQ